MKSYLCRVVGIDRVSKRPVISEFVDPCAHCGRKHQHGFGSGERTAHCNVPGKSNYTLVMPTGAELDRQIAKAEKVEAPYSRVPGYAEKQAKWEADMVRWNAKVTTKSSVA